MNAITVLSAVTVMCLFCKLSHAGETFSIAAIGKPKPSVSISMPGGPGGGALKRTYVDVVSTAPINCSGTSTNKIMIFTGYTDYFITAGQSNYSPDAENNATFIATSELISAGKNGLLLETNGPISFDASASKCVVADFYIRF